MRRSAASVRVLLVPCRLLPLGSQARAELSVSAAAARRHLSCRRWLQQRLPSTAAASVCRAASRRGYAAPAAAASKEGSSARHAFTLDSVTKRLPGGRTLFRDLRLSFYDGAKIGVLGVNGCGKSSFMRIIAGVDSEYEGRAVALPGYRVGYLPQEPLLDDEATVLDNVMGGVREKLEVLRRYEQLGQEMGREGADLQQLTAEQEALQDRIERDELWELDNQVERAMHALSCPPPSARAGQLSGGERRRVALCRLLLSRPDILLLDEPTNHLDAASVAWLETFLAGYRGLVIAITHDRYFLDSVAGYILEIDAGKLYPHKGNYASWLQWRERRLQLESRRNVALERLMARELQWLRQGQRGQQAKSKARVSSYEAMQAERRRRREHKRSEGGALLLPEGPPLTEERIVEVTGGCYWHDDLSASQPLLRDVNLALDRDDVVGIIGCNGSGKCFALGTRLRLHSGETAAVQELRGGELLMGDDSRPRIVTPGSCTRGRAPLYRIEPLQHDGAAAFTVNGEHILVLRVIAGPQLQQADDGGWDVCWRDVDTDSNSLLLRRRRCGSKQAAQALLRRELTGRTAVEWEVSVDDFLAAPADLREACRMFQPERPLSFQPRQRDLRCVLSATMRAAASQQQLDWTAWYLGLRAAGRWTDAAEAEVTADAGIAERLKERCPLFGQAVELTESGWSELHAAFALQQQQQPALPAAVLCDSVAVRRAVLAGLIDSCGRPSGEDERPQHSPAAELAAQEPGLLTAVKELAASLGLRSSAVLQTACGHRLLLSGELRPVLLLCAASCWRAAEAMWPAAAADCLCWRFSISAVGHADYFGFAVHGGANRRFLLHDFTVTHNTTLLRLLVGELQWKAGSQRVGRSVRLGYVNQHRALDEEATVWQEVVGAAETVRIDSSFSMPARAFVAQFNFSGADQSKRVGALSGGERNRLHIAKSLVAACNVIVLDEPTNDLDVDTLRALEDALQDWTGAALVVSHDRWFIDRVCNKIIAVDDGAVAVYEGGWREYEAANRQRKKDRDRDRLRGAGGGDKQPRLTS